MDRRLLCRGSRIPATRYLLILGCGLAWIGSVIILIGSVCLEIQAWICRAKHATIMHQRKNIGQVELATMSFGQSFQVTPIQMATTIQFHYQWRQPCDTTFRETGIGSGRNGGGDIFGYKKGNGFCQKKHQQQCVHFWKVLCQKVVERMLL